MTLIKTNFSLEIRDFVDQYNNVKDLPKVIEEQSIIFHKSLNKTTIMDFSSLKLIEIKKLCDHIMYIRDITAQLKASEVTISDSFLVRYTLCTLPYKYTPFNTLLTMCFQEEERLLMEEGEMVNLDYFSKEQEE